MSKRRQHFCMPTLGSWGNRSLRESWLSWVWSRVDCAWTNINGLESQYLLPLWHHTNPPSRLIPSRSTARSATEAAPSGRRLLLWTPAPGEVEASWILPSNSSGPWCQRAVDYKPLKSVQWRAPCQAVTVPPQSRSGTQACSASRDGIAGQVREAIYKRGGPAFLSSPLPSCRYYIAAQSSCNIVIVVGVHPLDSGISYLWEISIVCLDFVQ